MLRESIGVQPMLLTVFQTDTINYINNNTEHFSLGISNAFYRVELTIGDLAKKDLSCNLLSQQRSG